jgi:hypothetical protein
MIWKEWIGKSIFVQLRKGGVYSGKVLDIGKEGDITFITILDKFNNKVTFSTSEILKLTEEENGKKI